MDIFAAWSWWCNLVKHFSRWYLRSLLSRIRSASKTLILTMLWLKHSGYSTNYLVNFLHVYRYLTLCNCCISCFYQAGIGYVHDDVIKLKHFPRYWPFVRGIHRWPVNSPHKCQWRGALMFSLICAWIKVWVNNRGTGDLRRHRAHYDVTVMI